MITGLLLGCAFGASIGLLVWSVVAPRPSLGAEVRRWEGARSRRSDATTTTSFSSNDRGQPMRTAIGRWITAKAALHGVTFVGLRSDLALGDTTLEHHLTRKVGYGVVGLLLPVLAVTVIGAAGVLVGVSVPAILSLALGVILFWVPDLAVAQHAELRRRELRRALSCYLDLVAMSLAGGRGIPEAVPSAARIGTGWAFELLQDTVEGARYVGSTPWQALADLGRRVGLQELQDLGGALLLVADDGARVRASLSARASTQRRRQLAEAEGAAAKADQSIQMAQVVLAVGFLLFLGYPAVVAVLGV